MSEQDSIAANIAEVVAQIDAGLGGRLHQLELDNVVSGAYDTEQVYLARRAYAALRRLIVGQRFHDQDRARDLVVGDALAAPVLKFGHRRRSAGTTGLTGHRACQNL